jgi:trehalose 6-phosphate phosphatase
MTDSWVCLFDGWNADDEGRREALTTLGNGFFATRGAMPEARADGVHYPGTYAAGCYNRLRDELGGQWVEHESVVNLPNWLDLRFAIEDGDWFSLAAGHVLLHRVRLDMRRALLVRELRFVDPQGRHTSLRQRRFVHLMRRHLAGLHTVFTAEDWSGRLRVAAGIDGAVANAGVARYAGLAERHLHTERAERVDDETLLLVARTTQSEHRIAVATRTRAKSASRSLAVEPDRICHELVLQLNPRQPVAVEKLAAIATSRDLAISEPALVVTEQLGSAGGFDELFSEHELGWQRLWRRFRLVLHGAQGGGSTDPLRTLRLNLFHLLQTVSGHNLDLDAGVPARGLHGEAYRGHVFWDELFVLPLLTLRLPTLARELLLYRVRRLDRARRAAREAGLSGAMYPWQSGSDGREEAPRLHLNPLSRRWIPDNSHLQRHVGLAVAFNIWHYYQASGDLAFLAQHGAEVLLELARFFAALARYDPSRDRYRIHRVMGPDEYSTSYPRAEDPGIDDNAYTNVMTVWLMARAEEVLDSVPPFRRAELIEQLDLRPEELLRWRDIGRRMYVPFGPDGVISQFEGYHDLPDLDWETYRRRYGNVQRLDRILESEGRSVDDYRVSKQADTLMLFYLFSAEELRELLGRLGYGLPPEIIRRTIDFYAARTAHGSTLSALVHAWVLARADREQAFEHFERVLISDVADIQGGTVAEGVHLGAMAGSVDLLQRCFAGLEPRGGTLWFNPHWPSRFGLLEFVVQYRERQLTVRVSDRQVQVAAEPGTGGPVRVGCGDLIQELRPGETVRFRAPGGPAFTQAAPTEPAPPEAAVVEPAPLAVAVAEPAPPKQPPSGAGPAAARVSAQPQD